MSESDADKITWAYKLRCWTCKIPLHDANDPEERKRATKELTAGTLVCGTCKREYMVTDKGKNDYTIHPKK